MRREWLIGLALAAITLFAFWPVGHLGFIILDDHDYVTDNPHIQAGITAQSVHWAFTSRYASNWHPLTWLSHMLDCQLFGLNASGHHWVNLGLHIANTLLLFVALKKMMRLRPEASAPPAQTVWRSALVAALFALHPLRVESVAWISERKDVLCGFFFMLTLLLYAGYVERAKVRSSKSKVYYGLTLICFALGLMSKPMLVTLPAVLLLLDFWPLNRFTSYDLRFTIWPLIREKLPFLMLSLASSFATLWAQSKAVIELVALPWYCRAANVLVFYTDYLRKIFWPENLSILYLYPHLQMPTGEIVRSVLWLSLVSAFCLWRMRSQPYLLTGWVWFGVMLVPVVGLVQVGLQSIADRYTYLPSIGLSIAVVWGLAETASRVRFGRAIMTGAGTGVILVCLLDTRLQLGYWQNSVMLFSHACEATGENPAVVYDLGIAFADSDNLEEAVKNYRAVIKRMPTYGEVHYRLGSALLQQNKFEEARAEFDEALRLNPDNIFARKYLGDIFFAQAKYAEAEAEYTAALEYKPTGPANRTTPPLAGPKAGNETSLAKLNLAFESLRNQLMPDLHLQLAAVQTARGEFPEAVKHYRAALGLKPDSPETRNNLAWLLATCPDAHVRDGVQAVAEAERACQLTHYQKTIMVGTLAAAYAEAGRFDEAIATAQKACAMAAAAHEPDLLQKNQELLARYQKHQPYHESTEKLVPAAP